MHKIEDNISLYRLNQKYMVNSLVLVCMGTKTIAKLFNDKNIINIQCFV